MTLGYEPDVQLQVFHLTPPLSKAVMVHSKTAMEAGIEVYPLQP